MITIISTNIAINKITSPRMLVTIELTTELRQKCLWERDICFITVNYEHGNKREWNMFPKHLRIYHVHNFAALNGSRFGHLYNSLSLESGKPFMLFAYL